MKTIQFYKYGSPEVLQVVEMEKPIPNDNEILIKNFATTVNSGDVRLRKADPFLVRLMFGLFAPRIRILGNIISGVVESVGQNVTKYKAGDEIFGINDMTMGAYSQYLVVSDNTPLAFRPNNCTFEQAAAIVFGGHTALHFLKKSGINKDQKILVYGASGAVGSSAVQLAKYYGANVTAVCSGQNTEMIKLLGADKVIDYTKQTGFGMEKEYDIVFETVDKTNVFSMAKLVKPSGVLILGGVIIKGMIQGIIASKKQKIKLIVGTANVTSEDMDFIKELVETGKLKPVIDRSFDMESIVQAHEYVDKGHKKGNVIIKIQ